MSLPLPNKGPGYLVLPDCIRKMLPTPDICCLFIQRMTATDSRHPEHVRVARVVYFCHVQTFMTICWSGRRRASED